MGWAHEPSVHRSVSFVVEELVRKMIPYSSFSFPCCMVLIIVWLVLDFRIHVYCLELAMRMLRLGYLF